MIYPNSSPTPQPIQLTYPDNAPEAFHLLAKPTGAACNLDCAYCFFLDKEMLYPGSKFRMSGMSFVRTVVEEIYDIPRERVIGSNVTFEPRMTDAGPVLYRKPGLVEPMDDGPGKPVNIELHIGRKPIVAGGNADGDIEMLWYAETNPHKSLQLVLHHDDDEREYAYEGASAEKVFPLAQERNWTVISMKNDWREVF